ncbi:helix-turn-helix domain-containing protein [Nocardioides guangzhouensis]|nr:helix-turn-helix domain-containing protein [Nocardioides guangzhouensis]
MSEANHEVTRSALDGHNAERTIDRREDGTMEQQQLFSLRAADEALDGTVEVRPNLWLMTSEDIPPLLFTVDETARLLSIARHRVFDLIREGRLRSVKVGASRRVSAKALFDFVATLEVEETG